MYFVCTNIIDICRSDRTDHCSYRADMIILVKYDQACRLFSSSLLNLSLNSSTNFDLNYESNEVVPKPETSCLDTIFSSRVHRRLSSVSFRARDAKSDVNQVKRTKCVYSSTLTKIKLFVMQWRVKRESPTNKNNHR